MDTRNLTLFLHLSETLHFGRASLLGNVSPSALSRVIRHLEEELGAELFKRDNRSVQLTPEGVRFADYARQALQNYQTLKQQFEERNQPLHGELRLFCSVTASYSFLYDILNRFRKNQPHIEIKLHTGDAAHAIQRVEQDFEDIAIGAKPERLPRHIRFKPITHSELCFIAPDEPNLITDTQIKRPDAESWQSLPLILPEGGLVRERMDRWLKQRRIKPNIYAQVGGNEAIVSMVSLGFGIGVVPRIVLDNSPLRSRIRILDIQPSLAPFEIGLFAKSNRLKESLIDAFWALH